MKFVDYKREDFGKMDYSTKQKIVMMMVITIKSKF
ncbi:hypothetical protein SUSAZ_10260 [Sulfolobus acidocaldarius SUSAZ]|nr:hypothetical protein SUSAZ_10260 [Sulfolobus acidocaldarius SUSAZ]